MQSIAPGKAAEDRDHAVLSSPIVLGRGGSWNEYCGLHNAKTSQCSENYFNLRIVSVLNILTATLKRLRDASALSAWAALLEKWVWSQHQIPLKESPIYTPATPSSGNYQLAFPSGQVFYVHVAFCDWFWHNLSSGCSHSTPSTSSMPQ